MKEDIQVVGWAEKVKGIVIDAYNSCYTGECFVVNEFGEYVKKGDEVSYFKEEIPEGADVLETLTKMFRKDFGIPRAKIYITEECQEILLNGFLEEDFYGED